MIDPAIMPTVWDLWKSIEAIHVQKDASLRHEAWMHFVGPLAMAKEMDPCLVAQAGVFSLASFWTWRASIAFQRSHR